MDKKIKKFKTPVKFKITEKTPSLDFNISNIESRSFIDIMREVQIQYNMQMAKLQSQMDAQLIWGKPKGK